MNKGWSTDKSRGRSSGYTLFELLVVLLLIGMMSALAAPRITGSLPSMQLKTAAKKVAACLRQARSRATAQNQTMRAGFDLQNGRLVVTPEIPPGQPASEEPRAASWELTYELPAAVRFMTATADANRTEDDQFTILFFPTGASSGGEIMLADQRDKTKQVSVDFITGAVRLGEGKTE